MIDTDILDLDFLLDDKERVGVAKIGGVEYDLFSVNSVEDFLTVQALAEQAQAMQDMTAEMIVEKKEVISDHYRRMISRMVPDCPDEVLRKELPTLGHLQKAFILIVMKSARNLPESVKKNFGIRDEPKTETAEIAEGNASES